MLSKRNGGDGCGAGINAGTEAIIPIRRVVVGLWMGLSFKLTDLGNPRVQTGLPQEEVDWGVTEATPCTTPTEDATRGSRRSRTADLRTDEQLAYARALADRRRDSSLNAVPGRRLYTRELEHAAMRELLCLGAAPAGSSARSGWTRGWRGRLPTNGARVVYRDRLDGFFQVGRPTKTPRRQEATRCLRNGALESQLNTRRHGWVGSP